MKLCSGLLLVVVLVSSTLAQQRAASSVQNPPADTLYRLAKSGDKTAQAELTRRGNVGNADAQYFLGFMYREGEGVPKDYLQAANWFQKAADQDDGDAQYELSRLYMEGLGVIKDLVTAYMWINLAAAKDNRVARVARSVFEDYMTPAQIAEGQKLSREWKPKK